MKKKRTHKQYFDLPHYSEGPAIDRDGNWYYTSLSGGTILRRDPQQRETVWATAPCPNGQVILASGQHLVCDSRLAALLRYDAGGTFMEKVLHGACAGEAIHVPNDVIENSRGTIYFTDSIRYQGLVGSVRTDGEQLIVARGLDYPNGLALSQDEKTLFVAESYQNRILSFSLDEEGRATGFPQVVANLPAHPSGRITANLPDGIKVDSEGHLWVAHYGMGLVHRLTVGGSLVESLEIPFPLVSNLFIGKHSLLVTGGHGEPGPGGLLEIEL